MATRHSCMPCNPAVGVMSTWRRRSVGLAGHSSWKLHAPPPRKTPVFLDSGAAPKVLLRACFKESELQEKVSCPWSILHQKCFKPCAKGSKLNSHGFPSCGQQLNQRVLDGVRRLTASQCCKSTVEVWGEGRSRATSRRTFTGHVRQWRKPSVWTFAFPSVAHDKFVALAAGSTTGVHEVAALFSHTLGMGTWPGTSSTVGLCSAAGLAICSRWLAVGG